MSGNDHDISVLNGLIAAAVDSAEGYAEAAKAGRTSRFAAKFITRSSERRRIASRLQAQVRMLGGTPEDEGTILGAAHRVFLHLRDCISKSDMAVIDEIERGEDHIKEKFDEALKDTRLSSPILKVIAEASVSIIEGHTQASELKRMLHAAE